MIGERIGKDLKNRLFTKLLKHNYSYLLEQKPSKILTIINNDTTSVKDTFAQTISFLLIALLLLGGSTFLMFQTNSKLATIIVITVPTVILILFLSIKSKFKLFKKQQKLRDKLNKIINENIKASMLIKVFVSEQTEIEKFYKTNKENKNLGLKINAIFALIIPTVQTLNILCAIIVIYIGGQQIIGNTMTIGDITAFNSYILMFTMPLLMIAVMSTMLGQAMASLKRINELLDAPIKFKDGKENISEFNTLEFKNVSFDIEKSPVLKDIDFKAKKGQKIGVMGLTGSGKTIFLKHIIRALEPTKGKILFNNKNLEEYKIKDIRNLIGYVFQENFLFNGTILENIKFGRNIPDEHAIKCAKIALVDEYVKDFKEGYNTNVGEQGNNLSGGQKQRVLIARALADNPQLLILDDATSRLDISTERQVFENIKKEYKDITMILVAQKIASVKDCNQINIFDKGKITNKGTHEELLQTSVLYKEIELTQQNYEN
jgi:ATP-binding cassette subfamily B protein